MNKQLLISPFFILLFFQNIFSQARYLEPVFDEVSVTKNIIYGTNASVIAQPLTGLIVSQPLVLDFYEPAGDTISARPLVLVLPGGYYLPANNNGFCDGSKDDISIAETCTRLAKMGYTAAAVDYRQGWSPASPDQQIRIWTLVHAMYRGIQDARTAIRFFKKTAAEDANPYRVDTSRIVLWGDAVGGQIALGAAYANDSLDWVHPSLMFQLQPGVQIPVIMPEADGNIWGTDWGIVPAGYPPGFAMPGDTLCHANWPGYSSDFQLCVSMAGVIPDLQWVGAGEVPAVLFHVPDDALQPCGDGITAVTPFIGLPLLPVTGGCALAEQMEIAGNNQVFKDANIIDCITINANNINDGLEGFYPFNGQFPPTWRPWYWNTPCANNPDAPTDEIFARPYIDTMIAYFAPRACAALALCNAQSLNPGGFCAPSVKGKVFVDVNDDGYNPDDPVVSGVVLELQPGNKHAVSNSVGNYVVSAPTGDYILNIPSPPLYYTSNNTPAAVFIPATNDTVLHIGLKSTMIVNDLMVTLTSMVAPRPGFDNRFDVRWKNVGTTPLSGNVTFEPDDNYNIVTGDPQAVIAGATATWTFSNLAPFQQGEGWLTVHLPSSVSLGTILSSSALGDLNGLPDNNLQNNSATVRQTVIGSYDPNDKNVSLEGEVTEMMLSDNQNWLDYTVRFQNTGTASAINIFIVDTISEILNINTLEILGSSHPMRWEISGQRTVTWFFDNINLPDSVNNELASHGYVRYRIQPKLPFSGLLNKSAYNFADIYFDFNAPVRTNTTETEFVLALGTKQVLEFGAVSIAPNPAREQVTISCPLSASVAELSVYDVSGKLMLCQKTPVISRRLNTVVGTSDFPKGNYIVKVIGDGEVRTGMFVKE